MVNIIRKHNLGYKKDGEQDEFLHEVEKKLHKLAKPTYISLDDYKNHLAGLSCNELKKYGPSNVRVPDEPFQIKNVYKKALEAKCKNSADDKIAAEFAIQYIAKIADELDKNGSIEVANVLDEVLQEFAALQADCEDCN